MHRIMHRIASAAVAAVLAATLAPGGPARADIRRMYEAGAWTMYAGTATSGRSVCDMRVADDASSKKIDVIYFMNDDHLTVRMNKTTWRIPAKTRVDVVLQFDAYPVWTATADGDGADVEFTVPTRALGDFSRQFRYGSRLRISFPDGSEAPWLASLAGTNFMLDRFLECVQRIRGNGSQPYAETPAQPTQPSQPFANDGREGDDAPSFGGGQPQPYRGTQPRSGPAAPAPSPAPAPAPAPQAPTPQAPTPQPPAPQPPSSNDDRI